MPALSKQQILDIIEDIGGERFGPTIFDWIDEGKLDSARNYLLGFLDGQYAKNPSAFTEDKFREFYDRLNFSPEDKSRIRPNSA
jgi:hypothetical protein